MEIKIFTVSTDGGAYVNDELNKFLRSHKVIDIEKHFVGNEQGGYWSFCVSYISGGKVMPSFGDRKEKKDYRQLLDEATFATFERLRAYRKQIAKDDAVPAFAVFKDVDLINMAKLPEITVQSIKTIKGVGEKKLEKYGELIVKMYQKDEASGKPD